MGERVTAPKLAQMKERGERIVCVTAYDATFGRIADEAGVDLILVGDSVGNVLLGHETTVPVTMEEMLHHTRATWRGVRGALLTADLPFGSYQAGNGIANAVALMQAGAEAVKLEGEYTEEIRSMVKAGIPVMGHLGFTPQSVHQFGGHKVQGRGDAAKEILRQAEALEQAGAFAIVLELMPARISEEISKSLRIPTIGIGAGAGCDGQIQVMHDILGLNWKALKHAKEYADGRRVFARAFETYASEVREHKFPTEANSF